MTSEAGITTSRRGNILTLLVAIGANWSGEMWASVEMGHQRSDDRSDLNVKTVWLPNVGHLVSIEPACEGLQQGVILSWEDVLIQHPGKLRNPSLMKGMKDSRIDAGPIVERHH